jgi:hypothetical protein
MLLSGSSTFKVLERSFNGKFRPFHRHRPPDIADSFLLYEYYFTAVFNGLMTFDVTDENIEDIPTNDSISIFTDFSESCTP